MTSAVNETKPAATNTTATVPDTAKPAETRTVYAHPLDAQAYSGSDLGFTYTKEATTFKVWAPTASSVAVRLYKTGSSGEPGAQEISTTAMQKGTNGVWSATLKGDRKDLYYTYLVTVNGVTCESADLYARAAGVNGNRSMIVDLKETDPDGWDKDRHIFYDDPTDAIVWEVHIKDFSSSEVSGVSLKHKGKYLAFTEKGTTLDDKGEYSTCIDYLKKLGVTHVQLLPVYDYATVDESDTGSDQFNWGYDPKNYNVPEGSYSTDPFNGKTRIKEFKQMIMALHEAGIGVIMDVVYNHTFTAPGGWFEMTVPGYYYRMNDDGTFSDASACGNETASDHLMYRKYMKDSILYWTKEYHIDGFRFDLMGVHDVTTMNEIRKALDTGIENGTKVIMYGEPWTGGPVATKEPTAVKENIKLLNERIGAFNDNFRDSVKGHVFNAKEKGFVQDGSLTAGVIGAITANTIHTPWAKQPSQAIAYLSAHDNFTLYDKLVLSVKGDESFDERDERLIDMNRLGAAITLTSQGINFMQAGEEFARTKLGDENSYVSSTKINQLDWNCVKSNADLVSYYAGLIEIRKHFKPFRDPTMTSASLITFSETDKGVIAYTLENTLTSGKEWSHIAVLFNANDKEETVALTPYQGKKLPAEWTIIADKYEAGVNSLGSIKGTEITIPPCSAMVLVDKESFDKLAVASDNCTVRVQCKDTDSGAVLSAKSYKGTAGSVYSTEKDASLDTAYDLDRIEGEESGRFTKEIKTVTYYYKKFDGKIVDLTINYLEKQDELLGGGDKAVAAPVTRQLREGSKYSAGIKTVDGMETDLEKFPHNASGTAGTESITVNYYYKPLPAADLVLHYFKPDAQGSISAYVYAKDEDRTEYTGTSGQQMQPDAALGSGWYSLTVKGIGNKNSIYCIFSDSAGNDESFGPDGCRVHGELWINGHDISYSSTVNVIHMDASGNVLDTEVITGKTGTSYTTAEKTFDGLELSASTSNKNGEFSEAPAYVIYQYSEIAASDSKPTKAIGIALGVSAAVTAILAATVFALRKKKA